MSVALGLASGAAAQEAARGFVYTASNEAAGNRILGFEISARRGLVPVADVSTGGLGSGGGLGNQDGLVLSPSGRWLLAVNAGSDEISLLSGRQPTPLLLDKVSSGGRR